MGFSAKINGKHLLRDWDLYIENTDIIGSPQVNDTFVQIYGGKDLDLTEMNGSVTYRNREINLELGGLKSKNEWRSFLSQFLNAYHGKLVEVVFDDDTGFFYKGRAYIYDDVDRVARVGKFKMNIDAEPYKYEVHNSQEPWKFDPFNFQMGVIRYIGTKNITASDNSIKIPRGNMLSVPIFIVSQPVGLKVIFKGKEYNLVSGRNRYPQIRVGGANEVILTFKGTGNVRIDYRGGSL